MKDFLDDALIPILFFGFALVLAIGTGYLIQQTGEMKHERYQTCVTATSDPTLCAATLKN